MDKKFIFITGGVVSSLGKGLLSASIGMLLESRGMKIAMLKFDPYLNVDPGTMNPFQHGEVYVTDDGSETDLDLGHYYRFTNSPLSALSNTTSGRIYDRILVRERRGDYLGNTVQVIPHVTDEIKAMIEQCAEQEKGIAVTLVEIGGTAGDIESQPFMEAIRQFRLQHPNDCLNVHLSYVPYIEAAGEVKTKPTQHSVQMLRSIGIVPDLILCRATDPLSASVKDKISLFCSVPKECVLDIPDVRHSIYELPVSLHAKGMDRQLCSLLGLPHASCDMTEWNAFVERGKALKETVTIGLVGKYLAHRDAYKSVCEALVHAGVTSGVRVVIRGIESDGIEKEVDPDGYDGYLVPGGFGDRGWEGKIAVATLCRNRKIPYFGICLGMQVLVVEFARSVLGLEKADSTEMNADTPDPVISLLSEQEPITMVGGTMRLGAYPCLLAPSSKAHRAYRDGEISERHRHRYEFNNAYKEVCEQSGLVVTGTYPKENLVEIVELRDHPWMIGVQFHPEFRSKPIAAHPLFVGFIEAAMEYEDVGAIG
ncbi:MAG: CTP synthase [Simkaniaceae bacterium]|nr:CTP synthase [Simkaniaceae bacterium]